VILTGIRGPGSGSRLAARGSRLAKRLTGDWELETGNWLEAGSWKLKFSIMIECPADD
jgi:hypothetical protein